MKLTPTHRWSIAFLSVLLALGLSTGCKGRKARKAIEEAQAAQTQAQEAQAPMYTPQIYNNGVRLLSQAEQVTGAGNHDEAISLSEQAQGQFQQAIATVPQVRSKIEGIRQELDTTLQDIENALAQAREEGVAPEETVSELETQLEQLRSRQVELATSIDEEELQSVIEQAQQLKERADLAKLAHLKPRAEEIHQNVQSLMEEAQNLNASKYLPDELATVQPKVEDIQNAYSAGNWPAVVESATEVVTALQDIVTKTQQATAGEFVARAEKALSEAKSIGVSEVPEYANLIGQAETALNQAKQSLDGGQHSEAYTSAEQVMNLLSDARDALGNAVQQMLETANASIEQARAQEVEKYAPSELAATNAAIQAANDALAAENYVTAYSKAKSAQEQSAGLSTAALRGHAQQELSIVQNRLGKARAEGAEQYAQPVYGQVATELTQLEDQFKGGQYSQVINQAPQLVPRIDEVFQKLREGVNQAIAQGEVAIALAREAKAEEWASDLLNQAVRALSQARSLLNQESYRKAADNAEAAAAKAKEAEAQAYKLRAQENLSQTDSDLRLAERADSPDLSPLAYSQAVDTMKKARELLAEKDNKGAWEISVQAEEAAQVALDKRIIDAQEACDAALAAEARTYNREDIDQALALLNEAKAAQEAQNFDRANETAQQAIQLAQQAESFAWRQRSKQLLGELARTEQLMQQQQASVHVPSLARRFTVSLAEARIQEIDEKWEVCYEAAADARDAAQSAWKQMTAQLQSDVEELQGIARSIDDMTLDTWAREQKLSMVPMITELQRLVELEQYVAAFAYSETALEQARAIKEEVQHHNLAVRAEELSQQLQKLVDEGPAKILENRSNEIRALIDEMGSPDEKYDYKELIARADAAEEDMNGFPEQAEVVAEQRTTQASEILQQAQQAQARKFYPDRLAKAVKDLQWLRNELQAGDYNSIHQHLTSLEAEAPAILEDTSLAVAEQEYKDRLSANLTQMQNLIRDFDTIARLMPRSLIAARATETTTDSPMLKNAYKSMQSPLTARRLLAAARLLEENVKADDPPQTLNGLKELAVESFRHFRKAAEGFAIFGETDKYDIKYRNAAMEGAYEHLEKTLRVNKEIEYIINQRRSDNKWERLDWKLGKVEQRIERLIWRNPSPKD